MNNKLEAQQAIHEYFSDETNTVMYYCDTDCADHVEKMLAEGSCYFSDAPDMFACAGNTILIVEHFEVDCFEHNRKGSSNRREKAEFDRFYDSAPCGQSFVKKSNAKCSLALLRENIKNAFEYHYKQSDRYIKNEDIQKFKKPETKFEIMFLIQNTSPLGIVMQDTTGDVCAYDMLLDKEILDYIKEKEKINYILYLSKDWNEKQRTFLDVTQLCGNYENCVDYDSMNLISGNVYRCGGKMKINTK